jgi:Lar family restriction alleviation protein
MTEGTRDFGYERDQESPHDGDCAGPATASDATGYPVATTLLPCPFCGNHAILHQETQGPRSYYEGWCETCDYVAQDRPNMDDAIRAWNTRAPIAGE